MESTNLTAGIFLSLVAGSLLGTFAWPMKRITTWRWEHIWLMYSVWALIVLPWLLAYLTVPDIIIVYKSVHVSVLAAVFLFGAGWGIASIGYGIGLSTIGIALGTAIVLGMNNAIGAIMPIIIYNPEELFTPAGKSISLGVIIMLVGIVICSVAGSKKERRKNLHKHVQSSGNFKNGLIICLVAGVFGAMFNFALVAGKPIEVAAVQAGASSLNAANTTWCVSLLGGFIVTAIYCGYLIRKGKSLSVFATTGNSLVWFFTFIMALMWFGGVALYGTAVMNLGKLGTSIGWPLIQSMAVVSGNIVGIISGEWKGTGKTPLSIMMAGLAFLIAGMVIISKSGSL